MIHYTGRAPRFAYMIQALIQTGCPGVRIMYVLHCTTYYRHVRFTPFNIAVPWATNYMVPDPAEEFSKQGAPSKERGHLIQHCQGIMIAYDSDTDSARCLKGKQGVPGPGVTVYRGVVTVLTCAPVSPPV